MTDPQTNRAESAQAGGLGGSGGAASSKLTTDDTLNVASARSVALEGDTTAKGGLGGFGFGAGTSGGSAIAVCLSASFL